MANYENQIKSAVEKYEALLRSQLERVEKINAAKDFVDYTALPVLTIGICGGDGIGPIITKAAQANSSQLDTVEAPMRKRILSRRKHHRAKRKNVSRMAVVIQ